VPDDHEHLRPATSEEVIQALSFAIRFEGTKPTQHADEIAARIAAERMLDYLGRSRSVVMKRPPEPTPSTSLFLAQLKG
jgi:hypothetical protein